MQTGRVFGRFSQDLLFLCGMDNREQAVRSCFDSAVELGTDPFLPSAIARLMRVLVPQIQRWLQFVDAS